VAGDRTVDQANSDLAAFVQKNRLEIDPYQWAKLLHQSMEEYRTKYDAESETLKKRKIVGEMLGELWIALKAIPEFQKSDHALLPLKDLVFFLKDLELGKRHPWSMPLDIGGTNISSTAHRELRSWVKAVFNVLRQDGFKPKEAYVRIADGLAASGRKSAKGVPIGWRLVQAWCREEDTEIDSYLKPIIAAWFEKLRALLVAQNHVDQWGKPFPEREMAGQFSNWCWLCLPILRDRSHSGGLE
jgi:hypothetical protein